MAPRFSRRWLPKFMDGQQVDRTSYNRTYIEELHDYWKSLDETEVDDTSEDENESVDGESALGEVEGSFREDSCVANVFMTGKLYLDPSESWRAPTMYAEVVESFSGGVTFQDLDPCSLSQQESSPIALLLENSAAGIFREHREAMSLQELQWALRSERILETVQQQQADDFDRHDLAAGLINADQRRIYISNITPRAAAVLMAATPVHEVPAVRDLLGLHLTSSAEIRAQIRSSLNPTFTFAVSIPYYNKSCNGDRIDYRSWLDGSPLRKQVDVPGLLMSKRTTKASKMFQSLQEAHTTICFTGVDDKRYTAFALVDSTRVGDLVSSFNPKPLPDKRTKDPITRKVLGVYADRNDITFNPRLNFLWAWHRWIAQAAASWHHILLCIDRTVDSMRDAESSFLASRSAVPDDMTVSLDYAIRGRAYLGHEVKRLEPKLSDTLDAWRRFQNLEIRYFEPGTGQGESDQCIEDALKDLDEVYVSLQSILDKLRRRIKILGENDLNNLLDVESSQISKAMGSKHLKLTEAQMEDQKRSTHILNLQAQFLGTQERATNSARRLTYMRMCSLPLMLAFSFFSMQPGALPFEASWRAVALLVATSMTGMLLMLNFLDPMFDWLQSKSAKSFSIYDSIYQNLSTVPQMLSQYSLPNLPNLNKPQLNLLHAALNLVLGVDRNATMVDQPVKMEKPAQDGRPVYKSRPQTRVPPTEHSGSKPETGLPATRLSGPRQCSWDISQLQPKEGNSEAQAKTPIEWHLQPFQMEMETDCNGPIPSPSLPTAAMADKPSHPMDPRSVGLQISMALDPSPYARPPSALAKSKALSATVQQRTGPNDTHLEQSGSEAVFDQSEQQATTQPLKSTTPSLRKLTEARCECGILGTGVLSSHEPCEADVQPPPGILEQVHASVPAIERSSTLPYRPISTTLSVINDTSSDAGSGAVHESPSTVPHDERSFISPSRMSLSDRCRNERPGFENDSSEAQDAFCSLTPDTSVAEATGSDDEQTRSLALEESDESASDITDHSDESLLEAVEAFDPELSNPLLLAILLSFKDGVLSRIESQVRCIMQSTSGMTQHINGEQQDAQSLPSSSTSTSIAQDQQSNSASRPNRNERGRSKRPESDDGDEEEEGRSKRTKSDEPSSTDLELSMRLACPFYKRYPGRRWKRPACSKRGWNTVHRVKEHVYRCHYTPTCPRCHAPFQTEDEVEKHNGPGKDCEKNNDPPSFDGITLAQREALRNRRRPNGKEPEELLWKKMFHIIFPDVSDDQIPGPYHDLVVSENLITAAAVARLREFLPSLSHRFRDQALEGFRSIPGGLSDVVLSHLESVITDSFQDALGGVFGNDTTPGLLRSAAIVPELHVSAEATGVSSVADPSPLTATTFATQLSQHAQQQQAMIQQIYSPTLREDQLPGQQSIGTPGIHINRPADMSRSGLVSGPQSPNHQSSHHPRSFSYSTYTPAGGGATTVTYPWDTNSVFFDDTRRTTELQGENVSEDAALAPLHNYSSSTNQHSFYGDQAQYVPSMGAVDATTAYMGASDLAAQGTNDQPSLPPIPLLEGFDFSFDTNLDWPRVL